MGDIIYLDQKGNVVKKPQGLVERIQEERPDLADNLQRLMYLNINIHNYCDYLYNCPGNDESELPEKMRTKWQGYVQAVGDLQIGLEPILDLIIDSKFGKKDLTDDKVIVVRSDRPFYDTLLVDKEDRIGTAEGWVGEVEECGITNHVGSNLCSLDDKVYQRFKLKNARKLSEAELKEWFDARITWICLRVDEPFINLRKKLNISPLGDENVTIYDKLAKVDHSVLKHILKADELAVVDISYKEACEINILPYYGERQIQESQFVVVNHYPNDHYQGDIVFLAEDSRKIKDIYSSIKDPIMNKLSMLSNQFESLIEFHFYIGKRLSYHLTEEQREHAKKSPEEIKWLWKYVTEQGLKINDQTAIRIIPLQKKDSEDYNVANAELLNFVERLLQPFGYEKKEMSFGYSFSDSCNGKMNLNTLYGIAWQPINFAGELLIIK